MYSESQATNFHSDQTSMLAPAQSQILEAPPYRPHILPIPEAARAIAGHLQRVPSRHEAFLNQKIFANLDVLRGIAILAVVFHHSGPVGSPWLGVLQENCRYGVSLFFALSGFLICSLLLREEQRNGQVSLTDFYIRRSLRLFPLYYGMLAVYCVLVFGLGMFSPENQAIFKERLPYNALYLSNFLPVTGPFFFAWSLAVEEQFYLVFGQLFRWARRSWVIGSIVLLVVVKPLMNLLGILALDHIWVDILFSYSEPLLLGVLGGFALNHRRGFVVGMATASPRVLAGLTLALVLMLATIPLHNKSDLDTQVLYALMALIVMGCAIRPTIPLPGHALLAHIGTVCYGIYLTHMLVIMVVQRIITDNPYLTFFLSSAGVTVLATVIYRYFESPILQYKKHFSRV